MSRSWPILCIRRVNLGFSPLYSKYGIGTTVFSALASGILTGKVRDPTATVYEDSSLNDCNSIRAVLSPKAHVSMPIRSSLRRQLRHSDRRRARRSSMRWRNCLTSLRKVRCKDKLLLDTCLTGSIDRTWLQSRSPCTRVDCEETLYEHSHSRRVEARAGPRQPQGS